MPSWSKYAFVFLTVLIYLAAYHLFFVDHSIFSWITLIHVISLPKMLLVLVASCLIASVFDGLKSKRHPLWILIVLPLLLSIFFFNSTQFNPDTWEYLAVAKLIQQEGLAVVSELPAYGYSALAGYPIILSILPSPSSILAFHVMLYLIMVYLVFLISKELFNVEVGFYGSLFAATMPILLSNHYFILADFPMTVFFLASTYCCLKSVDDRRWLAPTLFFAIASASIKVGALMYVVSVLPTVYLKNIDVKSFKEYRKPALYSFIILLVMATFLLSYEPLQERLLQKMKFLDPTSNLLRFVYFGNNDPSIALPFQIGFALTILFIYYLYKLKSKVTNADVLLLVWIILPFLAAHDIKVRYLLPMFPAIAIAASKAVYDLRDGRWMIYFTVASMALMTILTAPAVADSYLLKNVQDASSSLGDTSSQSVGIIAYASYLRFNPHIYAVIVDFYSDKDVEFMGFNMEPQTYYSNKESWSRNKDILNMIYPLQYYNIDNLDRLLENYSHVYSYEGGIFRQHNTYEVSTYTLNDDAVGPVDSLMIISDLKDIQSLNYKKDFCKNYAFNLYCLEKKRMTYQQNFSVGPFTQKSTYGVSRDNWLGENMLFMKPPENGQINKSYELEVPVNTSLKFSTSLRQDTWHHLKGDGVMFIVLIDDGSQTKLLFNKYIDPKNLEADRGLHEQNIDLKQYWGKNITLTFQTKSGPKNSSMYDTAGWGNPRIV